ncbi:MAG: ATPase, partial [Bacteroidetes bacterium 4572_77]
MIREVYRKNMAFELTGLYEASTKDQLHNFLIQLQHSSKRFSSTKAPKNWLDAFQLLMQYIDGLKNKKKKVIFIDEFPWIASARSSFLSAFEHFWNTYCTKRNDLIVVVCGSAASFMINKIIKNKGGLHNRITHKIRLMPFNLQEVKQFLLKKNIKLSNYDILQLYMVMGGVPYYLNHIKKGESVAQNIDRLCFSDHGALVDEFNSVFQSLFSNSEVHQRIIRALAKVKKGVSRKKLLEICGIKSGGVFSKALNELTESGFAIQNKAFSKKTKDSLYSLTDEYSLFYLKFMEQHKG